jgi:hypothetical protein
LNIAPSGSARTGSATNRSAVSTSPRLIAAFAPTRAASARVCPRRQSPCVFPAAIDRSAARSAAERRSRRSDVGVELKGVSWS